MHVVQFWTEQYRKLREAQSPNLRTAAERAWARIKQAEYENQQP